MSGTESVDQQRVLVIKVSRSLLWFELAFVPFFLLIFIVLLLDVEFRGGQDAVEWGLIAAAIIGITLSCVRTLHQLRDPPVLFECRFDGIQSRKLKFVRWEDIEFIDSNPIFGSMTFHIQKGGNITLNPVEAGYRQTKVAIDFVRKTAPKYLTVEL